MSFLFPLVLAANLILFLFLLAQTRNHQELKVANDRELANRQELEAALPGLQAEVSRLSKERQALEDAILGAQRTIAAAQEIDARTGQLRQTEKTLSASVQAQATTNVDQAEALATIVRKTAVANAQWKESNDRLSGLSQQLALAQTEASRLQREKQALETEIKSLNGAKAEAEDISSRIERLRREAKSLADSNQAQNHATAQQTAVLSEIIQTNAAASAELRKVKGSLEALNAEIGTRGKQIEGLTKQQADWTEIARVRAERADD